MYRARPSRDFLGRDADDKLMRAPAVVRLPSLFSGLFPGADRIVQVQAETVDDVMNELEARWPGMRDRLCDTTPALRRHINVFVAGRRAKLQTQIEAGADVFILTAVSGG